MLKNHPSPAEFRRYTIYYKNGPTSTGCSKSSSSKAVGESKPEAYPLGYVEDFDELRTPLEDFFSILLADSIPPQIRGRKVPQLFPHRRPHGLLHHREIRRRSSDQFDY
jgi:hypothetical protein